MTNNILNATMAGGIEIIPAGKTKLVLQINTTDRENLSTASWAITATGKSYTAAADASGRAEILVDSGYTYTVTLTHQGQYENDAPQDVVARSTETTWVYFDLFYYPAASNVTFVRLKDAPANVTVTATHGATVNTAKTDALGTATFRGLEAGQEWTFTATGYDTTTVEIEDFVQEVAMPKTVLFSMLFDATTFRTDPTGCLTYADDCAGFTPVSGPPSSLGKCTTIGSWEMRADGTSDNPLLDRCFYATFTDAGGLHEMLNPQNLTQKIATWDAGNKKWVADSGASSITTENTMFCYPALYRSATDGKISISTNPSDGTAYGATIDGHTYDYVAIGVYEGYVQSSSKLMSLSGKASTTEVSRPNFRTYARANKVENGHAMLWNYYQWTDWKILTFMAMKSFNGQSQIGQGGFTYNGSTGQGLCNSRGPFAGSRSTTASTSTSVKAFIENPWGYKAEFIDDFVIHRNGANDYDVWAGQNAVPNDSYDGSNKTLIANITVEGGVTLWATEIMTDADSWGLIKASGGSSTTGLCDSSQLSSSTTAALGTAGGSSSSVSNGTAGPSYALMFHATDTGIIIGVGARLAFVFDLRGDTMQKVTTTSSTKQAKLIYGPTVTLYHADEQETEDGWTYTEYRFAPGEYELMTVGSLPSGAVWDATLRSIERGALYREADDMIAKYTTDVPDESKKNEWVAYKAAVRATQDAPGYPEQVEYPEPPEAIHI